MSNPQAPYAVVPSMGPDGVGKTTLAGALAHSLYARAPATVTPPRSVQVSGMNVGVFEFRTARRLYQYVDFENAEVEARLLASSPVAGGVLLVSAQDGIVRATDESLKRAREAGVPRLVGVLSKCDAVDDPEMLDLVEMTLRDRMQRYEYPESSPVVRVSAAGAMRGDPRWRDCLPRLLDALDSWL